MAKKTATPLTEQQLQGVESLLQDLKGRANAAFQASDVYMVSIYADLVKVVSPIVQRAYARMDREDKARINKNVRALRNGEKPANATP